jgi:hypothetical protein
MKILLTTLALGALLPLGSHGQDAPAKAPAAQETTPPKDKAAASDQSSQAPVTVKIDAEVDGLLFFATTDTALPAATAESAQDELDLGPDKLTDLRKRLGKVYDFPHFQLLGRHSQKVFKEYESWVVPSKELCLKLDSRGPSADGGVNLHLQLWQEKKVLVKSDAKLTPEKPIIIAGPTWRKGRLIFVLLQRK